MENEIGQHIGGIYETHLTVASLTRSMAFYGGVIGLDLAHHLPDRGVAFYWVGGRERGMLGLWQVGSGPMRMVQHFAFRTSAAGVLAACGALMRAGIAPLGFNGEPVTEPVVLGWMPAMSVYFRDPDGHSIEFLSMLDPPGDAGFGVGPLSRWLGQAGPIAPRMPPV